MFIPSSSTPAGGIRFAAIVSFLLMIMKAIIGWLSGSLSILGSALDSFMDIFVSGVNMLALSVSGRSGTKNFSYGFGKVQGFAAIFEGLIVLSSGALLIWSCVNSYLHHTPVKIEIMEIGVMLIAMLGSLVIMWNFRQIQQRSSSLLVESDALHYSSDLYMNGGVLISILGTRFLGWWWLDAVFGLFIGLYIIYNSFDILKKAVTMLLDRALDAQSIEQIRSCILETEGIESYHNLRSRRSGDDIFLEVHLVFRDKDISLKRAHAVGAITEGKIRKLLPNAIITVHLDTTVDGADENLV